MSLFPKRPTDEYFLVLEIESTCVRASVVKNAEIIFVHAAPVPFKPGAGSGSLVKTTLHVIRENMEAVLGYIRHPSHNETLPKHITTVHYVMTSPWIVSQAKRMSLSFPKPAAITKDSILKLLTDERKKYNSHPDTIQIIEEKISDVRLNGYSVTEWSNRETSALEVEYAVSVAGSRVVEKFRELAEMALSAKHVHFHSSLVLGHVGLSMADKTADSCTFIEVHGEMTDVAVLRRGVPAFFGSFTMGYDTVVRKVAHGTKSAVKVADSLISLEAKGQLDPHHAKHAEEIITNMKDGWAGEFRKMLETGSAGGLPSKTFLLSAISPEFFDDSFKRLNTDSTVTIITNASMLYVRALSQIMLSQKNSPSTTQEE